MNWVLLLIMLTWFGFGGWAAYSKKNENYKTGVGFVLILVDIVIMILVWVNS